MLLGQRLQVAVAGESRALQQASDRGVELGVGGDLAGFAHGESLTQNAVMLQSIRGWIASALTETGWTADEVWQGIGNGDFHLFLHDEGCMVGEFIVSPRHKAMHIFAAGGSLKAMDDLGPTVEAFGRLHNCDMTCATGRKGWLRYARKHGYQPAAPVIWKEL